MALKGARGYLVFDGAGVDESYGPLEVRYAKHADTLIERLAAEHRGSEVVCLVSSDAAVRGTSGQEVQKRSSATFLGELQVVAHSEDRPKHLGDTLAPETRAAMEDMRRAKPTEFTTVERDEVAVLFVAEVGPPGEIAARVWKELESRVPDLAGRKLYGAFYPKLSEYRACIEVSDLAEDAKLGLESAVLPGGTFLRTRLRGDPSEIYPQIGPMFDELSKAAEPDLERPGLELYRRRDEVDLFLPV